MSRFFIEVAYKGTNYSGFQVQENANTIQAEIEKAFYILHRNPVVLTGSSRTDAGVHAFQNYFHFDYEGEISKSFPYKMNSILPDDVVIKHIHKMNDQGHSRFDAVSREYEYHIYRLKNPFLKEVAFYYPYQLNLELMQQAASNVLTQTNFYAFAKTNTQVKNFNCAISKSEWTLSDDVLIYNIEGNRFLRGMVRLLTGTILKVGREQMSIDKFSNLFYSKEKAGYSAPAKGLFLKKVNFPLSYFM